MMIREINDEIVLLLVVYDRLDLRMIPCSSWLPEWMASNSYGPSGLCFLDASSSSFFHAR